MNARKAAQGGIFGLGAAGNAGETIHGHGFALLDALLVCTSPELLQDLRDGNELGLDAHAEN